MPCSTELIERWRTGAAYVQARMSALRETGNDRLADLMEAEADRLVKCADELAEADRTFPIVRGGRIPWAVAELAYIAYAARFGNSQSLERLAERGGFYVGELDDLLPDWRDRIAPRKRQDTRALVERVKARRRNGGAPCDEYQSKRPEDYGYGSCKRCGWFEPEHVIDQLLRVVEGYLK